MQAYNAETSISIYMAVPASVILIKTVSSHLMVSQGLQKQTGKVSM